jgi:hypothetical protein
MIYEERAADGAGRAACAKIASTPHMFLSALLLAWGLASCSPDAASIAQADYATKIVGGWQGTVGDTNETIKFDADGKFVSEVRPLGFISNTLGQGVTGTIRGTWAIKENTVTLNITSAQDERLSNRATTSTIEAFKPNELVVKSSKGDTSTFRRLL